MIAKAPKCSLAVMSMIKKYDYKTFVLFFVFLLAFLIPAYSAAPSVAVIYPEIRAPFNKIFTDMADGVEEKVNGRTVRYILKKDYSQKEFKEWLQENDIKVCVALGVRSEKATSDISTNIPVILGGVLTPKNLNSQTAISLAPSPNKLFEKLKKLAPDIRKIEVVYNPSKTEWLVKQAQLAAENYGLELHTHPTSSLAQSAKLYKEIFKDKHVKDSAIWLPPDPTAVDNRAILSYILEQSWKKEVPVFSSSLAHANKGVLFAMYPDNVRLGQALGKAALDELNGNSSSMGVIPVEDLQIAFNKRTAEHLGINFSKADLRNYDAVFPSE